MSKQRKPFEWISLGGIIGAAIVGLFWWGSSGAAEKKLSITGPGGMSMELNATEHTISHKDLLEQMDSTTFVRAGMIDWLATKRIFEITDPKLADALRELCSPFPKKPDGPLTERMKVARTCAELPIAGELRKMATSKEVPFHYEGREVMVGFPAEGENRPPKGRANTCKEDVDFIGEENPTDEYPQWQTDHGPRHRLLPVHKRGHVG